MSTRPGDPLSHRRASEAVEPSSGRRAPITELRLPSTPWQPCAIPSHRPAITANALAPDEQPLAIALRRSSPRRGSAGVTCARTPTAPEAATVLRVLATYGDPALRGTFAVAARHDGRVAAQRFWLADMPRGYPPLSSYARRSEIVSASARGRDCYRCGEPRSTG